MKIAALLPALIVSVLSLHLLSGCIPVMGAAATSTGVVVAQDRTVGRAIDDKTIWAAIKEEYLNSPNSRALTSVNTEVIEGRVLLSGSVDRQDTMIEAVDLTWKVKGVNEVINEIQIREKSVKHFALDSWVTTQVKTKLLVNEEVRSLNYHVETVNGVVYIFGKSKSQREVDIAIDIARNVPQVKNVISHVHISGS